MNKKYIDIFTELYTNASILLKNEIDKTIGVKQSNIWHPEGDTHTHIKLVTNRLYNRYGDVNLTLAGLFHDLGKTYTTFFNTEKNTYSAIGHEAVSVHILKDFKEYIISQGADFDTVEYIVANHMRIKYLDDMRITERVKFFKNQYFTYVQQFTSADYGGTELVCKPLPDNSDIDAIIIKFDKREKEKKEISSKFNGNILMSRYPELKDKNLGNAINGFKKTFDNFNMYVLSNTAITIIKDFDDFYLTI